MDKEKFKKILEEKIQKLISENIEQVLINKIIKKLCNNFAWRIGQKEKIKKREINKELKLILKKEIKNG